MSGSSQKLDMDPGKGPSFLQNLVTHDDTADAAENNEPDAKKQKLETLRSASGLSDRLSSFLPKMKDANAKLDDSSVAMDPACEALESESSKPNILIPGMGQQNENALQGISGSSSSGVGLKVSDKLRNIMEAAIAEKNAGGDADGEHDGDDEEEDEDEEEFEEEEEGDEAENEEEEGEVDEEYDEEELVVSSDSSGDYVYQDATPSETDASPSAGVKSNPQDGAEEGEHVSMEIGLGLFDVNSEETAKMLASRGDVAVASSNSLAEQTNDLSTGSASSSIPAGLLLGGGGNQVNSLTGKHEGPLIMTVGGSDDSDSGEDDE